ncbi:MAG: Fe-S cluster assembly protein NifU [Candidatus Brocadiia bacterium]
MWDYTEKVLDHFRNPRNVGEIEEPDAVGEVGSMACGDVLRLTLKLDDEGRIADVRFKTFGCASSIASASALTELVKGKSLEEAERVTNQDIARFLGGLPEQKMHCSVMGREALEAAIENYRSGGETKHVLEGKVVCTCFGVTEPEIERVVRENDLRTVQDVTNYCKAGGGCGGCHGEIARIIARVRGEEPAPQEPPPPQRPKMTNIRKIQLIQETIDREIRPMLQQDGGDIELIDVVDNRVIVSMRGQCAMCRAAEFTLDGFVGEKLREFVAPDLLVEEEKP